MKISIFVLLFCLSSFRLSHDTGQEKFWVGSFDVYLEDGYFISEYNGNYNKCFTKYVIDHLYLDCDTLNSMLDTMIWIGPVEKLKIQQDTIKKVRI